MGFSNKTKNALARLQDDEPCCQQAELAALLRMDGSIQIRGQRGITLLLTTENAAVARKAFKFCKDLFGIHGEITVRRSMRLKKNNIYIIGIPAAQQVRQMLNELGIMDEHYHFWGGIKETLIKKRCCRRAYLRGAFLGGGSLTNPEKGYHLEMVTDNENYGAALCDLMRTFSLEPGISQRKKSYVVYLKDSEQIGEMLNIMGAHIALLDFENIRALKQIKNNVNRQVNCETANLDKTIDAAGRQLENIKVIDEYMGLGHLSPCLKEIAYLRLEHPEASLKELGEMLNPPVGKSGMNHRSRRIREIARKFKKEE